MQEQSDKMEQELNKLLNEAMELDRLFNTFNNGKHSYEFCRVAEKQWKERQKAFWLAKQDFIAKYRK